MPVSVPKAQESTIYQLSGRVTKVVGGISNPNGVILSPDEKTLYANGDIFEVAIMAGPIGDVLASGQVVISSVKTLAGLKLSVTVRQGTRKADTSTVDAVKKMLLDARSITYVDPARGTIGINAWATVRRLGLAEELRDKTTLALGGPRAQELATSAVAEINLGPFFSTMR